MSITVTVLDTAGIQQFIYASNVLRENAGASEIVHRATRLWAFEQLLQELKCRQIPNNHNIDLEKAKQDDVWEMYDNKGFKVGVDSSQTGAEVLYAGGGNTVILFQAPGATDSVPDSLHLARDFVYRLGIYLLQMAPGLNLYAAHNTYNWGGPAALSTVVEETIKELGRLKGRDPGSQPALGWSVTAACTSTGLPANEIHPDVEGKTGAASRANRQVKLKWDAFEQANERLRAIFPDIGRGKEFDWTNDFETLADIPGRNDSYIAVVHADGNGMGARIKSLVEVWSAQPQDPRGYIEAMRALSCRVQETAQNALKRTVQTLLDHLNNYEGPGPQQHPSVVSEKERDGKLVKKFQKYLPMRPIVFGGDDVTLVCAGPWGLAVAQRYLWELESERLSQDTSDKPYACAGVAIVKTHYPFSQAYDLSEELLKSAKSRARQLAQKRASALDWYYTTTGLTGDLERMREREYLVPAGILNMTPIMLHGEYVEGSFTWRNWRNFKRMIDDFGLEGTWQEKRNKTLRLREALRGGPEAVNQFWAIYREVGERLPTITTGDCFSLDYGWVMPQPDCEGSPRCAYFEPIEVAEQFFELPDEED